MANITGVTSFFPVASENSVAMSLGGSVTGGSSTIVTVSGMSNYNDGDTVVFVVDPGTAKQQTFTGQKSGGTVINCVWTEGTNQPHTTGAAVIDYTTSTDWQMLVAGILKSHNQDGSLKTTAVQNALSIANAAANGWSTLGYMPTFSANNGNKEYALNVPADMTNILSPGMRWQVTRPNGTPTQCMAFAAANSQYASKASPSGLTFTGAFTCETWVYLNSYPAGPQNLVSRRQNSAGWGLRVEATTGDLTIYYGDGTNMTFITTGNAVPLKRWVHVAGVVNNPATKTVSLYMNGVLLPSSGIQLNATTISQGTGSVYLGAAYSSAPTEFLDGYLAETRVWSQAQTTSQIQSNMAISLTGVESGLVGLWQGNGNWVDKTSNANTMTPSGGAIATQSGNPYHAVEYGIITSVGSYSAGNTPITVFTGTDYNMPNAVMSSAQYSLAHAPFGFPASRERWFVDMQSFGSAAWSNPAGPGTWYNLAGLCLQVPTGDWELSFQAHFEADYPTAATNQYPEIWAALSTSPNSRSTTVWATKQGGNNQTANYANTGRSAALVGQTSSTMWYLVEEAGVTGMSAITVAGAITATIIRAECAYF